MSDMALIRRQNFTTLCKSKGWDSPAGIRDGLGWGRVSFWADLQKEGSKKSFGEKLARRIEDAAGLPRDALDAIGAMPRETGGILPLRDQEDVLLAAWRALGPNGREAALAQIEELVLATKNATSDALDKLQLLRRIPDSTVAHIAAAPVAQPAAAVRRAKPRKTFDLAAPVLPAKKSAKP